VAGVLIAGWVTGAEAWMQAWHGPLSGMFAATYIGGGANFNALALHYGVAGSGNLYLAATVADNVMTVIWVAALLLWPLLLGRWLPADPRLQAHAERRSAASRDLGLHDLIVLAALGLGAHALSFRLGDWLHGLTGVAVPPILLLTSVALLLAQLPAVQRLRGGQRLGMFGAYLFLAALGTLCELDALRATGATGARLMLFVGLLLAIHGVLLLLGARLLRLSAEVAAVVSACTVGGSSVVLPLVERFRREDLLLPGIVLGSLGNALGTYVGFAVAAALSRGAGAG
jgi:uncharacterized membrane protein